MSILSIVTLIAELAPRLISAGGAIADLWRAAGGIISHAEKNGGNVDPDAANVLRALVDIQLRKLSAHADEARNAELDPA